MIADIHITEKSFGDKRLMSDVSISVADGEKVGVVGRNGVGKSTLFAILAGTDPDYSGRVTFRRGASVAITAQEHHGVEATSVLAYILHGLPEYSRLKHIIDTYPATMGDDLRRITTYTEALERFDQKGFYQIEDRIRRELAGFQLAEVADRPLSSLSGGQKRLVEIVKIMHAQAHLALIDEPTNHMDYVAKRQFIEWLRGPDTAAMAMLVITHDRDVLGQVDRIIELKDGQAHSYNGNYDAYLRQNASRTAAGMSNFEQVEKRMANLRQKVLDYQRMKEKSRNPGTIQRFKRLEIKAREELATLAAVERPSFWIDKQSVDQLDYKAAGRYGRFKAKNIRLHMPDQATRSQRVLVRAADLALGIGERLLFTGVTIDLRAGEAVELRGRNGAGKTTLVRALLASVTTDSGPTPPVTIYDGEVWLDPQVRVGVYEQEIGGQYLTLPLGQAIERMHLDRGLPISDNKIRQLCADYLFDEADRATPLAQLSGGQKARFQIISLLAGDPQLLILDEPTNHLDLPSIEELEHALVGYQGAILYISHDEYFRRALGGQVVMVGGDPAGR